MHATEGRLNDRPFAPVTFDVAEVRGEVKVAVKRRPRGCLEQCGFLAGGCALVRSHVRIAVAHDVVARVREINAKRLRRWVVVLSRSTGTTRAFVPSNLPVGRTWRASVSYFELSETNIFRMCDNSRNRALEVETVAAVKLVTYSRPR
eukprot:8397442-Pyramimonas_sp.AAC.1